MQNVVAFALISAMIVAGIFVAYTGLMPVIERMKVVSQLESSKSQLLIIDEALSSLVGEGNQSSRMVYVTNPSQLFINDLTETFYYKIYSKSGFGKFYNKEGNILATTGDVDCYETSEGGVNLLVMENSHIKAEFYKYGSPSSWDYVNTSKIIYKIVQKDTNSIIKPLTTMDVKGTTDGYGYSMLLQKGEKLPECTVEFFVNGTTSYKLRFTLNPGVDFLVGEVLYS